MDDLAGLLDGPHARDAFLLRIVMRRPWSIRVQDEAPLALIAVVRGRAWLVPDDGDPVSLRPGDVAVARGPDAIPDRRRPGVRHAGHHPSGRAVHHDRWGRAGRHAARSACARGAPTSTAPTTCWSARTASRATSAGGCSTPSPRSSSCAAPSSARPSSTCCDAEMAKDGTGPGGRARPPARRAAHRHAAGLVRPARRPRPRPGTGRTATRSSGRALRLIYHDPAERWTVALAGRRESACRAPRWPAGSPIWWATRR